ncbi:TonB-dependent receptor [Rhodocaloribacter litoris]|uniref:TonB-dependent receptor n=1 Tax=Rhodocaloribacter litoris TaxID=2558931 RepID=UPI0014242882|nr:TonB-dependent receptor [Rhodocaloribacter litoris]QXD14433.1 TonB-dependent receptor [Rhodocaloribacter litoris]
MGRCVLFFGILLTGWLGGPCTASAQTIRLDGRARSLAAALELLREEAGVDVVYAERMVADRMTTCRYAGKDPAAALACLLQGTGLRAERVRARQYVLIEEPAAATSTLRRETLSGFVVDAETGEALPGAHVYLVEQGLGATTNGAGYFALPVPGPASHRVRVSYLGYQAVDTVLALPARAVTVALQPAALPGEEVVVEGTHHPAGDAAGTPGVVAVPVSRLEELPASLGGQDLFQALEWMPGVQRAGEVTGGLIVRGSGPDQNLYLLDGAPVYHPWHAFSLISTFQTDTFKDIRLYQGAFPAEHGGRLSAVLDAELKDGSRTQPHLLAALNALNARFVVESPITPNSSFMLSGRRSYIDKLIGREHPVEDEAGRRDTLRTGYYFYDWSAKLLVRPGARSRLTLSYYRGRDVVDLRLPFDVSLDFSSWLRPADLFFEIDQQWGNTLYSLRYQSLASDRLFLTVTGYDAEYAASEGTVLQPTSSASVVSRYGVRLRDLGLKVDVDYYHTLRHQLRAGVQVVHRRFRSDLHAVLQRSRAAIDTVAQAGRLSDVELAAYVQEVWQPTPRWRIQPGLRLSYFSGGNYVRLSPRLSLQYAVHPERLILRAAAGTQVQYLHRLRDRFSFLYDLVSSRWIPAGERVHPSRGAQVSVGAESRLRPWLALTVEGYWRGARNVLLPEDVFQDKDGLEGPGIDVGALLGQYVPGYAYAYGAELTAQLVHGPWHVLLSHTAARAFNRARDEAARYPSDYDVPASLRTVVQWERGRWRASVASVWRSGYPLTVPVARYVLRGPLDDEPTPYLYRPRVNNGRLPPYLRFDVTLGYRFSWLGARWHAEVHVYNLTNRRNVIDRTYDPAQEVVRGQDRYGLPLLPLFEFRMEL